MKPGEGEDTLLLDARTMLGSGRDAEEVFTELAVRTGDWGACALAVCLALGVPQTDAEARIREVHPLLEELTAGEEDFAASLLVCGQVFVVDRVLDDRGERIRDLLWVAAGARWGYPGSLLAWFRGGELTKLFLFFAKTEFRGRRGSPTDFWAAMVNAGELLAGEDGPDQDAVTVGLERCRAQAAALRAGYQIPR
ncbi:hypothetical protein ACIQF5_28000 [Streptomyces goshikiensis]|uniref:hypothetical protein n=1 Tax=Streptomyces goshikiensis TaxID=1942 RepID=UPI00381F9586